MLREEFTKDFITNHPGLEITMKRLRSIAIRTSNVLCPRMMVEGFYDAFITNNITTCTKLREGGIINVGCEGSSGLVCVRIEAVLGFATNHAGGKTMFSDTRAAETHGKCGRLSIRA